MAQQTLNDMDIVVGTQDAATIDHLLNTLTHDHDLYYWAESDKRHSFHFKDGSIILINGLNVTTI